MPTTISGVIRLMVMNLTTGELLLAVLHGPMFLSVGNTTYIYLHPANRI